MEDRPADASPVTFTGELCSAQAEEYIDPGSGGRLDPGSDGRLDTQAKCASDTTRCVADIARTEGKNCSRSRGLGDTMESSAISVRPCSSTLNYSRWQHKYRRLKSFAKEIIYLNAAYCDEVVTTEVEIAKAIQQTRYLVSRLSYRQHLAELDSHPAQTHSARHSRQATSLHINRHSAATPNNPKQCPHVNRHSAATPNNPEHSPHPGKRQTVSHPNRTTPLHPSRQTAPYPHRHTNKHSVSQYYKQSGASFLAASLERKTRKKMVAKSAKREEKSSLKKGQASTRKLSSSVGSHQQTGEQHTTLVYPSGKGNHQGAEDVHVTVTPHDTEVIQLTGWPSSIPGQPLEVVQLGGIPTSTEHLGQAITGFITQPAALNTAISAHQDGLATQILTGGLDGSYLGEQGSFVHLSKQVETGKMEEPVGNRAINETQTLEQELQGEILCLQTESPYVQTNCWSSLQTEGLSAESEATCVQPVVPGIETDRSAIQTGLVSVQTVGLLPPGITQPILHPASSKPQVPSSATNSSLMTLESVGQSSDICFDGSSTPILNTDSGQVIDLHSGKVFSFHPSSLPLIGLHPALPVLPHGTAVVVEEIDELLQPPHCSTEEQTQQINTDEIEEAQPGKEIKPDTEHGNNRDSPGGRTRADRAKDSVVTLDVSNETDTKNESGKVPD